jgi:hypothetical protein
MGKESHRARNLNLSPQERGEGAELRPRDAVL